MNRKDFIKAGALSVFAVSTFGFVSNNGDTFGGDCDTTNDILGPFYRPSAPERYDLITETANGHIVEVKGTVFGPDCVTPLKHALVEIWHCNADGEYDNETEEFNQRARWFTDEDGKYAFRTILPGKYLNGKLFRPAHIHFRVSEENSKELISQIYFQGDPHIEEDPWASKKEANQRILPIQLEDTRGNLAVNFDIYLARNK